LKKEISCLETRLDSAEFCISSCLSRMAKMEVWMTLGTRTQIPTRHMLDTLGVQTTSDSNVPSGQKLGLLKMYP